jgi:predicted PurR-regulated permease PerM
MPGGPHRIVVPRWIQLVGLPVLLVLAWAVAGTVRHAIFIFLAAGVIAMLLDPLVRSLADVSVARFRVRRGVAVAIVYVGFAAALVAAVIGVSTLVASRAQSAADRIEAYLTVEDGQTGLTGVEHDVDRFQGWLDSHGLENIRIRRTDDFLSKLTTEDVTRYSREALDFLEGAAISAAAVAFAIVLIVVVSIYMLLDLPRFRRAIDRRFPPSPGGPALTDHVERALVGYVKGQLLLSVIIGASAGVGIWALGALGLVPGADRWALVFGTWVALMELIPYLGPWLGAIPPVVYALVQDPISALWVVGLFLLIHQVEGHVVVPNVMGRSLRLHPLLVIFGLVAGFEIYGIPGALVTLPVLAAGRACWEFFSGRVELEPWGDELPPPVVEVVEREPPAAASR